MTYLPYRILFTGWRGMRSTEPIAHAWSDLIEDIPENVLPEHIIVVHGAAHGLDQLAGIWAMAQSFTVEEHPADWDRDGKKAGPMRNEKMVKLGADVCLAFPGPQSIGTWDCIRRAVNAGINTRIYPVTG